MRKTKSIIHESSGNVFADIGLPNADVHLLKAQIISELYRLCTAKKLSQTKTSVLLGISQPEVSRMFNGHFSEYSVERLMKFLTVFARDIEIVVRPTKPHSKAGKIRFTPEAA
jgi:predicted XRE-type DNA-binding protein